MSALSKTLLSRTQISRMQHLRLTIQCMFHFIMMHLMYEMFIQKLNLLVSKTFGVVLGSFWGLFGVVLGSFWGRLGSSQYINKVLIVLVIMITCKTKSTSSTPEVTLRQLHQEEHSLGNMPCLYCAVVRSNKPRIIPSFLQADCL